MVKTGAPWVSLVGVRFITWYLRYPFLRECRWGLMHFWECLLYLGYSSEPGLTLKKALCSTHALGGALDKYQILHFVECWPTRPANTLASHVSQYTVQVRCVLDPGAVGWGWLTWMLERHSIHFSQLRLALLGSQEAIPSGFYLLQQSLRYHLLPAFKGNVDEAQRFLELPGMWRLWSGAWFQH